MAEEKEIKLSISSLSIFKIALALFLIYILFLIRDILVIFFISLVLASALGPWVDWMQKKKIPRTLGMLLIYLVLFLIVGSALYAIIPPIKNQLGEMSQNIPYYLDKISSGLSILKDYSGQIRILKEGSQTLANLSGALNVGAEGALSVVSGIFGGLFSFFLTLAITFYMAVEENALRKIVVSTVPSKYQLYILRLAQRMQVRIGLWLRGQLILCLIIGVLCYVVLASFGIKYALVLALIAGFTEFIPYLGPIIGAAPAVMIAFFQSPMLAVVIAVFYYAIQFFENNYLVPQVMKRAVGLNPIVSIAVILIGFKLAGIAGAILSIPVATAGSVLLEDIFEHKVAPGAKQSL